MGDPIRIVVDYDLCASTGMCTSFAPEIFELQADGTLLLLKEHATAETIDAVQGAVDGCPVEAISLEM